MHVLAVIPARFGSVRLPGKPLRTIAGEPLIRLVAARVLDFRLDAEVVVATDDERVAEAVAPIGITTLMTKSSHLSGTERIGEVVRRPDYQWAERVLNIQGDEPFVAKEAVLGVLDRLDDGYPIGTAAVPLLAGEDDDPARVKVGVDSKGRAKWFSRFVGETGVEVDERSSVFLHVGVYAYTREALLEWVDMPVGKPERLEGLEQLRPMENGVPIGIAVTRERTPAGIDTEADLRRARSLFNHSGTRA